MAGISALLVVQSRIALGLSQRKYGELLGIAERTVQRWEDGGAIVTPSTIATLAAAVHPKDPALAGRIATYAGTSLLELGIEKPPQPPPVVVPAPPPPPPLPPLPTSTLVDSIVCVAADAIGVLPRAIRPALAAAFQRAQEVRLDVAAVAESLNDGEGAGKVRRRGRVSTGLGGLPRARVAAPIGSLTRAGVGTPVGGLQRGRPSTAGDAEEQDEGRAVHGEGPSMARAIEITRWFAGSGTRCQ